MRRTSIGVTSAMLTLAAGLMVIPYGMMTCTSGSIDGLIASLVVTGPFLALCFLLLIWLAPFRYEWLWFLPALFFLVIYAFETISFAGAYFITGRSACAILMNSPSEPFRPYPHDGNEMLVSIGHTSLVVFSVAALVLAVWRRKRMNVKAIVHTN